MCERVSPRPTPLVTFLKGRPGFPQGAGRAARAAWTGLPSQPACGRPGPRVASSPLEQGTCASQPCLGSKVRRFRDTTWSVRLVSAPDLTPGALGTSPCADSERETFSIVQNQQECWLRLQRARAVPGREPLPLARPRLRAACPPGPCGLVLDAGTLVPSTPFPKGRRGQLAAHLSGGSPGLTVFLQILSKSR